MRIVVFSDSHGDLHPLQKIVKAHPDARCFVHLGDGQGEVARLRELYPKAFFVHVKGNCDWGSSSPDIHMMTFERRLILCTHGHTLGVKHGTGLLEREARLRGAVIALFGHTHMAMTRYVDGLYLMNPGSVSQPRDSGASYGVIDLEGKNTVTRVVRL